MTRASSLQVACELRFELFPTMSGTRLLRPAACLLDPKNALRMNKSSRYEIHKHYVNHGVEVRGVRRDRDIILCRDATTIHMIYEDHLHE